VKKIIHSAIGLSLSTVLGVSSTSMACTGFAITQNGKQYVAKNFDRPLEQGKLLVNARGVKKVAFTAFKLSNPTLNPAMWVSRYGSVTLNQAGVNFPFSGMNEKNLVVEVLSFKDSVFPADSKLPVVSEAEWTQYILDTSANLQEAESNARKVQVKTLVKGLHYFVCDASKQCALFEYTAGDLAVYKFKKGEIPVVANTRFTDQLALQQKMDADKSAFYLGLEKIPYAINPSTAENGGKETIPSPEELERQKLIDQELAGKVDMDILNALRSEDLRRPLIARARLQDNYTSESNPIQFSRDVLTEVKLWDTRWNTVWGQHDSKLWFRMFGSKNTTVVGTKRYNYKCVGDALPKGFDLKEVNHLVTMTPKIHQISLDQHLVDIDNVLVDAKLPAQMIAMLKQAYKAHMKKYYSCL